MRPHRPFIGLCAVLLFLLTACTPPSPHVPGPSDTSAGTVPDTTAPAFDYKALVDELKSALLSLKQQQYAERTDYEARIKALEAEIRALEAQLEQAEGPFPDTDLPVGTTPTLPPAQDTTSPEAAFRYALENGSLTVLAYLGTETHVTIPSHVERYPVTALADDAFRGTSVVSVTVPDTVTSIGWFCFADCPRLSGVTLPASVSAIGYGAFDGCPALVLSCPTDSYAARYADSFGLVWKEQ